MASTILAEVRAATTAATTVMASGTALINGIAARVQTAIDKALENGATEAELAPVQAEVDAMEAEVTNLSAAISANTPAA